jgi:hypothetical protein
MSIEQPSTVLPPLYARWIDSLLAATVPHESNATCDDCAMCAPEYPNGNASYFSPRVKCCSYQPRLANFLVGGALADRDFAFSAGRETLEKQIASRVGLTPLGIEPSARIGVLYANSHGFGRAEALLCPYYVDESGGRCGIWRHRNAVCATWFCKHERGAVGQAFWDRLRDLLTVVEVSVATWCVLESDLDPEAIDLLLRAREKDPSLSPEDLDDRPSPRLSDRMWGSWLGREREFFLECQRRVSTLAWEEVERIGGSSVGALARVTRVAFEKAQSAELPERLVSGRLNIVSITGEAVRVVGYRGTDPLDLDPVILEILPHFDGRPTREVLRTVEEQLGVRVDPDLVRRLADFEILASPEP